MIKVTFSHLPLKIHEFIKENKSKAAKPPKKQK